MKSRNLILQILIGVASAAWGMSALATSVKTKCLPFDANVEIPLTRKPVVLEQKEDLDQEILENYTSNDRLRGRAYRELNGTVIVDYKDTPIPVSENFVTGVAQQISQALREGLADGITYSDMGHLHLMLPANEYATLKSEDSDPTARMVQVLDSSNLKALYHTVEMVKLKDGDFLKGKVSSDPWKSNRYATRNLLGGFNGGDYHLDVLTTAINDIYNTVRSIAGYTQVSTLYFSANQNGCFETTAMTGTPLRFDMTFTEIPYSAPTEPQQLF